MRWPAPNAKLRRVIGVLRCIRHPKSRWRKTWRGVTFNGPGVGQSVGRSLGDAMTYFRSLYQSPGDIGVALQNGDF